MKKLLLLTLLCNSLSEATFSQTISLSAGSSYSQDFNTLSNTAGSTTNNLSINGWYIIESGGGARDNEQYAVDNGGSNTGDTYSYGTASATDRALGSLRSGTLASIFGAAFTNNTGITLTSLTIGYTGEQWRLGTADRTDRIDFALSTDATSLTTGTWTDVDNLDFTTPVITVTGAKDGNASANRTAISFTISSLNIPDGATFWIRWTDADATNADDGLAVDDFTLSHTASLLPVKLVDFDVQGQQQNVVASWSTLTETNSSHFDLERADAATRQWQRLATVPALGQSTYRRHYRVVDASPLQGPALYRIKAVDLDGSVAYSAVKLYNNRASAPLQVKLYPNPASQVLQVQLMSSTPFSGWLRIINAHGQVAISQRLQNSTGPVAVAVQQLAAGSYKLQMIPDNGTATDSFSFVKE